MAKKTLRLCSNGHIYYKSSDCLVCPICESQRRPESGFLSLLSAPARRALENNALTDLKKISQRSEKEILSLHGIGPTAIPILKKALKKKGLGFKKR